MVTTKNWRASLAGLAAALGFTAILVGCTPAGPRALLEGERLLQQGKYPQAIGRLQAATQLLPVNAKAWNHLGVAYHHAGQLGAAFQAYQQARRCDPNLASVRYNLGCLLLDQHENQAALSELTSYTHLQRDSAEGWLKLGTAQLRLRQFDASERSLQISLRLRANQPEAWNALGVVQSHRRRYKEALNCFRLALQKEPHYAPALLNLGILYQQHLKQPSLALQTYQQYLELKPTPPDARSVEELARQLKAELAAPPRRDLTNVAAVPPVFTPPTLTNPPSPARPPTTLASAQPPSRSPAASRGLPATERTNVPSTLLASEPAPSPKPAASQEPPPAVTNNRLVRMEAPESKPTTLTTPTAPTAPPTPTPQPTPPAQTNVVVVQLTDEPPPKPAQDAVSAPPTPAPTVTGATASPVVEAPASALVSRRTEEPPRFEPAPRKSKGLNRLNPAGWFRGNRRTSITPLDSTTDTATRFEPAAASSASPAAPQPTVAPAQPERRYVYVSPPPPPPGDRFNAERFFAQAVQAHRDGRLAEAVENYRQAVELDPSFFEAQYNLGLAAYELKEFPLSLSAYETALSINPTSANARYNFALALEKATYYQDAANEFQKILSQRPDETRAHLSLAGLCANRLGRPDLARLHYAKVLELEPQHPQAAAIRFWLAANP